MVALMVRSLFCCLMGIVCSLRHHCRLSGQVWAGSCKGSIRDLRRLVGGQLTLIMGCCMGVTPITRAWLDILPELIIYHSFCCLAGWSAAVFPEDEGGHAAGKGSIAGHRSVRAGPQSDWCVNQWDSLYCDIPVSITSTEVKRHLSSRERLMSVQEDAKFTGESS